MAQKITTNKTEPVNILKGKRRGRRSNPLSPVKVNMLERRFKVMNMRRNGASVAEIARDLKCNEMTVRQDIKDVMENLATNLIEDTQEARLLQCQRLDALLQAYMTMATEPHNVKQIDRFSGQSIIVTVPPNPAYAQICLQIEQRRAKLLALDVPETKNLNVTGIREYIGIDLDEV